jgi:hypothetical protein
MYTWSNYTRKIIQLPVTQHVTGNGQPSENLRRQQSLFPLNIMYISTFFFNPLPSYDCLNKWCSFGQVSHYHSIKLTSISSVYIEFSRHACECANLSARDLFPHFFLKQFSYAVLYLFMKDVLIFYHYVFHFNPTNVVLLWPVEEWRWTFKDNWIWQESH